MIFVMEQRTIEMKSGTLNLTILNSGKLVIGELQGEKIYRFDLIKALKEHGIIRGYLDNCLGLIEGGFSGQIPIAQAYIEDEPGTFLFTFEDIYDRSTILQFLRSKTFPQPNMFPQVQKGQVLVEMASNPHTVLRYPDGRKDIMQELTASDIDYYSGVNTQVDSDKTRIIAGIEGSAHRSAYGVVHVYPTEQIKSLGKAHGKLIYENALQVEDDIRSGSDLVTQSNLWVGGMVRAAHVEAEGSIHSNYGFDNPKRLDSAQVTAGQSIYAAAVRQYRVKAGVYIFVKTVIEGSIVYCTNSVITPLIVNSEIRVGNKLYVHSIKGDTRIYLGRQFLRDTQYKEVVNFHQQHERGLSDIEADIRYIQDKLLMEQNNTVKQLNKLKRLAPDMIPTDVLLKRYLANQQTAYEELNRKIAVYERQSRKLTEERMRISFYENQFIVDAPPQIYIIGEVEAGVTIHAPNQHIKLKENHSNLLISLDSMNGKLNIEHIPGVSETLSVPS